MQAELFLFGTLTGLHANLMGPNYNPTWFPTEPEPARVAQRQKKRGADTSFEVPVLYMCGRGLEASCNWQTWFPTATDVSIAVHVSLSNHYFQRCLELFFLSLCKVHMLHAAITSYRKQWRLQMCVFLLVFNPALSCLAFVHSSMLS